MRYFLLRQRQDAERMEDNCYLGFHDQGYYDQDQQKFTELESIVMVVVQSSAEWIEKFCAKPIRNTLRQKLAVW
jgi:hypothetical protein